MFEAADFSEDEELPEDEEEILVYVEFPDCVENNMFGNDRIKLDIIGIDTESPVMQINGKFYEGNFEDVIGTYMFFRKDNKFTVEDPVLEVAPTVKYLTKTRKVLKMQRVFVTPRIEVLGDSKHNECIPNLETIKKAGVPPKYQKDALAFWENARSKRIDALNAYLEKQRIRKEKKLQGIEVESASDDENPFMFKVANNEENEEQSESNPEMNEFERFLRNTAEKPPEDYDVNDAQEFQMRSEPSTSRDSKPWIGHEKGIARNKGVVKVLKPTRRRNYSKFQKNAAKINHPSKNNSESESSTDELLQKITNIVEDEVYTEGHSEEIDTSLPVFQDFQALNAINDFEVEDAEVITDEIQIDRKPGHFMNDEYSMMEKRLQKKAKREAKMKELTEQLKKMSGVPPEEDEDSEELII